MVDLLYGLQLHRAIRIRDELNQSPRTPAVRITKLFRDRYAISFSKLYSHDIPSQPRLARHTNSLPLASMALATASSVASSGSSISLCGLPDGIIGKQLASAATRQSKITGFFTVIISLIASSSSAGLSQRIPWPP